jgi:hypothetical protein
MVSFYQDVQTLVEGKLLLDTLARYDLFQLEHNVKPDFSNAGGLQYYDEQGGEWLDWYDEDGEDIDSFDLEEWRAKE